MVSKDKMSKKARRDMARERRNVWTMSPVTRVKKSGKVYNRMAEKMACRMA